jgi:hypothetical protein
MSRGERLTDEQLADFYVKHDTYWVDRDGS